MQAPRPTGRLIRRLTVAAALTLMWQPLSPLAEVDPVSKRPYVIYTLDEGFTPLSISDNGLILGKNSDGTHSVKRVKYTAPPKNSTELDSIDTEETLATFGADAKPLQINDNNWQAGSRAGQAALWNKGTPALESDIEKFSGLTTANTINGFNEIAGTRTLDGLTHPFHYDPVSGKLTTLPTLGGTRGWANDLNDTGYITGAAVDTAGNTRAFRYESKVATLAPIGTLEGYEHSEGLRINDRKDVVGAAYNTYRTINGSAIQAGRRAFYSTLEGSLVNLGTIGTDLESVATAVNSDGQVIGRSIRADGSGRAFRFDTTGSEIMIVVADRNDRNTVYGHSTRGNGIIKSQDAGNNWSKINNGLTDLNVHALLIDPRNSSVLYAGTTKGLFISRNGGFSWGRLSSDLGDKIKVNALHIKFENEQNDNPRFFAGTDNGIYYSTNEGLNWVLASSSTGFSTYNFTSHLNRPDHVYAATNRGVYSSTNQGEFWSRQTGQEGSRLLSQTVSALAIDPEEPDSLYAATVGGGVLQADIAAGSLQWTPVNFNSLVNLNIYALVFYDSNGPNARGGSTIIAGSTDGVYQRQIGNEAWNRASNFGNRGVYSLSLSSGGGGGATLYASSFDGDIFRSETDSRREPPLASTWAAITRGISLANIYTLEAIPKDGNDPLGQTQIMTSATQGFFKLRYKSPGSSTLWQPPTFGASGMKITAIAQDTRATPYTLWAGSSDRGMMISTNNGDTWDFSNDGLDNWNITSLAVDTIPATPAIFAGTMAGVYRSDDGGRHWVSASNGLSYMPVYSLLLDNRTTPARLYAGTPNGVYRSSDYGRFWVPLNNGIATHEITTLQLSSGGHLFAGSISGGLFVSTNNGLSWSSVPGSTQRPILDLDEDPFQTGRLFAATPQGLYHVDCRALPTPCDWVETPFSGLGRRAILAVKFDPDNANHVYAGTEANGLLVSADLGNSWRALNDGITTITNRMEELIHLLEMEVENGDGSKEWLSQEEIIKRWDLQDATDINNNGEIIGWGYFDSDGDGPQERRRHGYLLVPTVGTSEVDLAITQSTQPTTVKQGVPFNYHIAITNHGRDTETNAKLIDWLPPDIIFRVVSTSATPNQQGSCERRPENIVRCELGGIAPGETIYVNISMESPYRDIQIHNIAHVTGDGRDIDMSNNTTSAGNTVSVDKCFIATAAYGSFLDPHVTALRAFRDEHLLTNAPGRAFVGFYYRHSPPVAEFIAGSTVLRAITRLLLTPVVYAVIHPVAAMAVMIAAIAAFGHLRRRRRERLVMPG